MRHCLTILGLLCALTCSAQFSFRDLAFVAALPVESGGGGGSTNFSDEFTGTGALSAEWEVVTTAFTRASDVLSYGNNSYSRATAVYTNTTLDADWQYIGVSNITMVANIYLDCMFRYTDAASPFYSVQIRSAEDQIEVNYHPTLAGTRVTFNTNSLTIASGDSFVITLTGTGNSAVWRVWKNPSTMMATSATDVGGDTTPDVEVTTDPSTAVDTGGIVGLSGFADSATNIKVDSFYGGGTTP